MKITVNFDKCASNARCMKACPQVFEVRDDGFLYILQEEPPEELRKSVEQAMSDCPTGAISVEG
jgi:ferredoxin